MSSVVIAGDISGSVTLDAPSVAGTTVLTLPATSGTVVTTATTTGISGSAITTGTVATNVGGTGITSFTANGAMYATSTSALTTGTLPVASGGTGANTLTANNVILGNGTSAVQFVAPGSNGNVLTSNGTTWTSAAAGGGQLRTQVFTAPGTFTTPASTTQVRVTVVGGGGGSAGPGMPQPGISGGASSFGALVSASGGSGAPNASGSPVAPGSGTVSVGTTIISSYAGVNTPTNTPSSTYISGAFVGGVSTNALNSVAYSVTNRDNGAGAAGGPFSAPVAGGGSGGLAVAIVPVTASTSYPISVGSGGPGAVASRFGGIGGVVVVEFVG